MNLRILEDHSPYYITFTFDGIEKITEIGKAVLSSYTDPSLTYVLRMNDDMCLETEFNLNIVKENELLGYKLTQEDKTKIHSLLPWSQRTLQLEVWNQLLLHTGPSFHHLIHKDRTDVGMNFYINIPDDKCATHFYDEDEINALIVDQPPPVVPVTYGGGPVRRVNGIDPASITPVKTFVGKQNEGILINTNKWHTWINSSDKFRDAILLRPEHNGRLSFEEARKELFGF